MTPGAQDWRTTFDLNVVHTAVAARAALPLMREVGGGAIVFIASVSGMRPQPRAQYAAAKAAEIHLAATPRASSAATESASTR